MLLNFDLLNDTMVKLLHMSLMHYFNTTPHKKVKDFPYFHHADEEDKYLLNIDVEHFCHHFSP